MINTRDPVWAAVSHLCEQGIENARKNLEAHGKDIGDTEYERGQLAAFKAVLDLAKPEKPSTLPRDIGHVGY
jgi:hypothetical protein